MNIWAATNPRQRRHLGTFLSSVSSVAVFMCGAVVSGDTFVVSNTGDSGSGSLREAINQANDNTGPDTIEFSIPGTGPHTIQPTSELPEITDTVIIDGYTQSGASPNSNPPGFGKNSVLMIELDGSNAGNASGLIIAGANCTVKGLVINRFERAGIAIVGTGASGNLIEGNFIGTDVTGSAALGNAFIGVVIQDAPNNTIGGSQPGEGNVISGNDSAGILIYVLNEPANASGNKVQGNYIGTDVTGSSDLGNAFDGVVIQNAPKTLVGGSQPGEGNVISGNDREGIFIRRASGSLVQGNYIGTDVTGKADIGNTKDGVQITGIPQDVVRLPFGQG